MAGVAGSQPQDLTSQVPQAPVPKAMPPLPQQQMQQAPVPSGSPAPQAQQQEVSDPLMDAAANFKPDVQQDDPLMQAASSFKPESRGFVDRAIDGAKEAVSSSVKQFKDHPLQALMEAHNAYNSAMADVGTLGYMPQIQGAIGAAAGALGADTGYTQSRDAYIDQRNAEKAQSPIATIAGTAAGTVGVGAATAGLGGVPTTLGEVIAMGAGTGGAFGAVANPGDVKGEVSPLQLWDRTKNAATGAVAGGVLGAAGYGVAKTAGMVSKAVDEWISPYIYKAEHALTELDLTTPTEMVSPASKLERIFTNATDLNESAKKAGITLYPHELNLGNPRADEVAARAMASPKFQQEVLTRGQVAASTLEEMGNTFKPSGTAQEAVAQGSIVDRAFGRLLGGLRLKAIQASEAPLSELREVAPQYTQQTFLSPLPQTAPGMSGNPKIYGPRNEALLMGAQQDAMGAMTQGEISSLGQQGSWQPGEAKTVGTTNLQKTLEELRGKFGFDGSKAPTAINDLEQGLNLQDQPGKTAFLVKRISSLTDKIANTEGKFKPREMDRLYTELSNLTDAHYNTDGKQTQAFVTLLKLKNAVRDDFTAGLGKLLGPGDQAAYQNLMGEFSKIKTASDSVSKLLETDSPSTQAIVKYLSSKGLDGVSRMADMKVLSDFEAPGTWDNIGKAVWDKTMFDVRAKGNLNLGEVNWNKLDAHINQAGPSGQQFEIAFGAKRTEQLRDLTKAMSAAQLKDGSFSYEPHQVVRIIKAVGKLAKLDPEGAAYALSSDRAAAAFMNSDQVAKFMPKFNAETQAAVSSVQNKLIQSYTQKAPLQ